MVQFLSWVCICIVIVFCGVCSSVDTMAVALEIVFLHGAVKQIAVWHGVRQLVFLFPSGRKESVMMRNWLFCFGIAAFMMAAMFVGGAEAFAQGGNNVEFTSIVEFGNLFDTIRTALAPIVVGALGLGLAIWGARYIFGVIKSMGR